MSSTATIAQLRVLMRSAVGAAKFEREKWSKELTPILTLWKRLNQGSGMLQIKLQQPGSDSANEDPVRAFVELEFFNAVSLLQAMHKALSGLSKVIRGSALLDERVARLADSLLRQETPGDWQKRWDGPENPLDYINTVCSKAEEVQKWHSAANQQGGSVLQGELDLSDLFHPDTFLGALRQMTASSILSA